MSITCENEIVYPYRCSLIVIQPTPYCNLECGYCYLNGKDEKHKIKVKTVTDSLLAILESGLIKGKTTIVWHAGEPLTMPIKYFEEILNAIRDIDPENVFRHCVQTNGTLINEDWCDLFIRHNFDVGVSLDGPQDVNDIFRTDRKKRGSFQRTIDGINLLKKNKISYHVISVLTKYSLEKPKYLLDFFVNLGIERVGFNIEEVEGINTNSSSITLLDKIDRFWKLAHDYHINEEVNIHIREFDKYYNIISNSITNTNGKIINLNDQVKPFGIISISSKGDFSTFSPELIGQNSEVYGDFIFGNVGSGFGSMFDNNHFKKAFLDINEGVKRCYYECEYFKLCGGGSPSNKYYENNGDLSSSKTLFCRNAIVSPIEVVLGALE